MSLLAKPTQHNLNLGSDRFAMFNKKRDIPDDGPMARIIFIVLVLAAGFDAYMLGAKYTSAAVGMATSILHHFGI